MQPTTIQECLVEYREDLQRQGYDLRQHHFDWHRDNDKDLPDAPQTTMGDWGVGLVFGKDFLEMHHMMLRGELGMPGHMHEGIYPWFAGKGYQPPPTWDGRQKPPKKLDYIPPTATGTVPSTGDIITLKRRTKYPPDDAPPGYPLPACFTVAGAQNSNEYEDITKNVRLKDFINVNQLGVCIAYYHKWWHHDIGGAMSNFYFSTDDPTFYFGVHYAIDEIYKNYLEITKDRTPADIDRMIAAARNKPKRALSPEIRARFKRLRELKM